MPRHPPPLHVSALALGAIRVRRGTVEPQRVGLVAVDSVGADVFRRDLRALRDDVNERHRVPTAEAVVGREPLDDRRRLRVGAEAQTSNVGDGLTGYQIALNPTGDLDRYFRAGQDVKLEAPTVNGYETPKGRTVTLQEGENVFTFTYGRSSAWGAQDPESEQTDDQPEDTDDAGPGDKQKPTVTESAPDKPKSTDAGPVQAVTVSAIVVLATSGSSRPTSQGCSTCTVAISPAVRWISKRMASATARPS